MVGPYKTIPTYGVSAFRGSDPIHRDVLKIIKLFAQNLRRHFFVRERYYTLRLAHVFGCYKLALAVRDSSITSRFFALKSFEYIECSGNVLFGHGFDKLVYVLLRAGDTEFKLRWKGQGIFSYKWVRLARSADKDVALQCPYR